MMVPFRARWLIINILFKAVAHHGALAIMKCIKPARDNHLAMTRQMGDAEEMTYGHYHDGEKTWPGVKLEYVKASWHINKYAR